MTRVKNSFFIVCSVLSLSLFAAGESCSTGNDVPPATRSAMESAATGMYSAFVQGNDSAVQQSLAPVLANNFQAVKAAMEEHKEGLGGSRPTVRNVYLLDATDMAPNSERAEFFCGIFGASGHTASSVSFILPGLPRGNYGLVIMDAAGGKTPYTLSFVLQQNAGRWQMAGFFPKPKQIAGFDAQGYWDKAKQAKAAGQGHTAWFHYLTAMELIRPVPFMFSMQTDKLAQEMQAAKPADLPGDQPVNMTVGGKSYKVIDMFPLAVGKDLALVVKYQVPDLSDTGKIFQDNMAFISGLVKQYPEYKNTFASIVARATAPNGQDFGTLLETSKVK